MTATSINSTSALTQTITPLLNAWISLRMPSTNGNDDAYQQEMDHFLKLPLGTVFALAYKNVLPLAPEPVNAVPEQALLQYLQQQSAAAIAAVCINGVLQPGNNGNAAPTKTNLKAWARQQHKEGLISTRLKTVLVKAAESVPYLEDLDEKEVTYCHYMGPKTMKEFFAVMRW